MRLVPSRIAGQLTLLLVAAVVLALVPGGLIGYFLGPGAPADQSHQRLGGFLSVVRLVAATPDPAVRQTVVAAARAAMPTLQIALDRRPPVPATADVDERFVGFLVRELGGRPVVAEAGAQAGRPGAAMPVAVALDGGEVLRARLAPGRPPPRFPGPLLGTVVFAAVGAALLSLWAARRLTGPLRRFAAAAQEFELGRAHEPLPDRGPDEIRAAARALNALRDRVNELAGRQSRMLAAVGHDLRTPITRLKLRTEFIDDPTQRAAFQGDLDRMAAMVEGTLTFLRTGEAPSRRVPIDLGALLYTIVDDCAELGGAVACEAPASSRVLGDEDALRRAFGNLIENGLRFGNRVTVRLREEAGRALVEIEDDGPGIPAEARAAMLEPFVRGDAARSAAAGDGFGLGLAIASAIVASHGGRLELADAAPHGLVVRISLPKA